MGRIVYQSMEALAVTADATQDLWSVIASSSSPIVLHGFSIYSADIAAEIVALRLMRKTAAGSGGTASTTEELADERFSAVTGSFRTLDTTPGAAGGNLMGFQWEQLGPLGHVFTPEMRPRANVSEGFGLEWLTAAAATVSGWVCWEEF